MGARAVRAHRCHRHRRSARGVAPDRQYGSHAAAARDGIGIRPESSAQRTAPAGRTWPRDPSRRARPKRDREAECRRQPGGSRRRRPGHRVPHEDECHWRRHAGDAPCGSRGGRAELRGAGCRQRRNQLLCRSQSRAPPHRRAGGELGRDRPDGPDVPGSHHGLADRGGPGRGGTGRTHARRRV